jgi:4-hydroxythreonine-4-phosphate dehydrogenase
VSSAGRSRRATALRTVAVTTGEPAGIGPDLCTELLDTAPPGCRVVLIGDHSLFGRARRRSARKLRLPAFDATREPRAGVELLHVPLAEPARPGVLSTANARYVLETLDAAIGARLPVMLLVGGGLRVALATTHLPLRKVSAALTRSRLEAVLRIVAGDLQALFAIRRPRLLVLGLNPHAGEGGHLGREEIEVIEPTLAALRGEGLDLIGPLPADTAFVPHRLAGIDAVVAMYHDQGLPVLKHASFGHAVNVTLGLPIVRTSVDHGTALDLAGTRKADPGSLQAALALALELSRRARRQASRW